MAGQPLPWPAPTQRRSLSSRPGAVWVDGVEVCTTGTGTDTTIINISVGQQSSLFYLVAAPRSWWRLQRGPSHAGGGCGAGLY